VDLLQTVPPVERARGFRLYGGNLKLIDLWQCGGAAILGHKPANVVRSIKNASERGLFAPFPNTAHRRFTKALGRLFPPERGFAFKVYADWSAVPDYQKLPVWRPFSGAGVENSAAFRPILPFPLAPAVIVCQKSLENDFPPAGFVSPLLLAGTERAVYDLLACPERGNMAFKRVKSALEQENVKKNWRLDGIYVYSLKAADSESWAGLFRQFLEGGFLLPPLPSEPLIIPGEMSCGEEAALSELLSRARRGC
jgi:hypothetical protein